MLMETGENPVQCRCCVGGAFFKMSLEIISGKAEKVMMPKSEYRLCAYLICCGPQYKRQADGSKEDTGAFAYNYGEIVWSGTGKVGVLRSIHRLFLFF